MIVDIEESRRETLAGMKRFHNWRESLDPEDRAAFDLADEELGRAIREAPQAANREMRRRIVHLYRTKEAIAFTLGRP